MGLPLLPFRDHCLNEVLGGDMASDRDREVAVAAASSAEGDVYVDVHAGNVCEPTWGRRSRPPKVPPRMLLGDTCDLEAREQCQHAAHGLARPSRELIDVHEGSVEHQRYFPLVRR